MSQQYKRSICHMCVSKAQCDGLRWGTYCGACASSLKCAAREGIANAECKKLRAAWLDLPRNCLLVSHLVNQKATKGHDAFHRNEDEANIMNQGLVCPRCGQSAGGVYVDHALNYLFKRETKYIYSCHYCGVDETVPVP